jgi:type IV secretion system protein VirB8
VSDAAVDTYLAEAASWDADIAAHRKRMLRVALLVAAAGWTCAVAAAIALTALVPLKQIEPFVIRVDNSTGVVDVVPMYVGRADLPETTTRHFLDLYVTTCERYNYATAEMDFRQCAAFHSPERNVQWSAAWARSNPDSPLNLYKDGTTIRAQWRSVSFFRRANGETDLAQVRYTKVKRAGGSGVEERSNWIATVRFAYTKPSTKDPDQKRWNPVGFRILDFQPELESDPPLSSATR